MNAQCATAGAARGVLWAVVLSAQQLRQPSEVRRHPPQSFRDSFRNFTTLAIPASVIDSIERFMALERGHPRFPRGETLRRPFLARLSYP